MPVYVDDAFIPYRRMWMSHMVADSLEDLHNMADIIGVNKRHFQNHSKYPHYDICKSKRDLAIKHGAIEVTTKELISLMRYTN